MDRSCLPFFLANQFRLTRGIIAIDGGSAVGKTTLARRLGALLHAAVISTDAYLIPRDERIAAHLSPYELEARRIADLIRDLQTLASGRPVLVSDYNQITGRHDPATLRIPTRVLILEGVHALCPPVREAIPIGLRIFFQAPEDIMRASRRARDERLGTTGEHWSTGWQANHETYRRFVLPEREQANIIITLADRSGLVGAPQPFLSIEWEKHEGAVFTASGQPS